MELVYRVEQDGGIRVLQHEWLVLDCYGGLKLDDIVNQHSRYLRVYEFMSYIALLI